METKRGRDLVRSRTRNPDNATHVPARESSKSSAHSLCGDVEKAGVNKLLAEPEELGSAQESRSSARLLCT